MLDPAGTQPWPTEPDTPGPEEHLVIALRDLGNGREEHRIVPLGGS